MASQRQLEYAQVGLSAENIFQRCIKNSHIAHSAETNPLSQLDVIGNYVSDLSSIIRVRA